MLVMQAGLTSRPKCRVELHIHLDGSIRPETIWEIMRKKKMVLPGNGSLKSLNESLVIKEPEDLHHFLKPFSFFIPAFSGDLGAIEQISFEFAEDQSEQDVLYTEARFCPHIFLPQVTKSQEETKHNKDISARDILQASLRGIRRGEAEFGIKIRLILCCIRGKNEWSWEILKLCEEYKDEGVVGIDIAGNKDSITSEDQNIDEIQIFEEAKRKGIHRSIHAGEDGDWKCIQQAIDDLGAERIGHGYRVVENEVFYKRCLKERIHFEVCPFSSYLTGAVKNIQSPSKKHPILRMVEDGASFSINSDDPTITGKQISQDYELLREWGFNEAVFVKSNFEAALKSFLPLEEKRELIHKLQEAYGVPTLKHIDAILFKPKVNTIETNENRPSVNIASWSDRYSDDE